jgi:Gas vesicle synthesis protein GvpL/GvpF
MFYVYAITDAAAQPDIPGLRGVPVAAVREGPLAAIVSEHEGLQLVPDEDELWAHEAVVETLMDEGDVLPMRMGSVVEDSEAVRSLLRERAAEFTSALENVRGAAEVGLRIAVDPEGADALAPAGTNGAGSGTAYMLSRLARKVRSEEVGGLIHKSLSSLARDHTSMSSSLERMSLSAAYLVERHQVDDFRVRVEELQREIGGVTIVCTGPWPPYSFTSTERAE